LKYIIAKSLDGALAALQDTGTGRARVVAGATDLFLQEQPDRLIDISRLPELQEVTLEKGLLRVGAAVTHNAASASGLIWEKAAALAEASTLLGSPQIRNIGTLGGNVANAAPAADAAVALAALGAEAVLFDSPGRFYVKPFAGLYAGYNCSRVDSCREILAWFLIRPAGPGQGSAFLRFTARGALSLPLANAAARVTLEKGRLKEVSLVVAPAGPAPSRLKKTEALLLGSNLSGKTWSMAEESASAEVAVRGSALRCSVEYRRRLIGILAGRVLSLAAQRAQRNR